MGVPKNVFWENQELLDKFLAINSLKPQKAPKKP